jgi:hypothetical protein
MHPLALTVKIDDSNLFADIRVQRYALAAAHAAVGIMLEPAKSSASPSDYTEATEPAQLLVKAMSEILMQVRRETLIEAANSISNLR